jgi:multidrug efflux pump subunit AcrB
MSDINKINKEFGLTTLSVKNSVTVFVLTAIIVVMGMYAYTQMPKESFPEIKQPTIYIGTVYPGNSPSDMENLITRPIEKELNLISSVDKISSTSIQDFSSIMVEFSTTTDVQDALTKVKDAVDKAKTELPSDLKKDPDVFELNFSEFPILNINLAGNYTMDQLKEFGKYLEKEIEKFPEISKVEIRGIDEKIVKVKCDPYKLEARKLNFTDIENAIAAENITMAGGNLVNDGMRRTIRVIGEFSHPSQLLDIVVKDENRNIVYLRDVATVEFGYKDKESFARLAGKPVVMVDVVKRSGENLLEATDKIFKVLDHAKKNVFPSDLQISVTNDQSKQTRDQVANLENSIISGVILVVLVLLFFLGTRNALFVGMAIPLSMFMSFLVLGAFGITINIMVLFSLIMALGMLVDNGIVIVENVYRQMEKEGKNIVTATIHGAGEIAWPIISSTATTLAAFIPLAFWPGLMGEFMFYLPVTLMITLGSSLFVALVINPVFMSKYMKLEQGEKPINHKRVGLISGLVVMVGLVLIVAKFVVLGNLLLTGVLLYLLNMYLLVPQTKKFQAGFLPWLERIYENTLRFALRGRNPFWYFSGTVILFILSFVLYFSFAPNVVFFPVNQPAYVNVFIEFPIGTDIDKTNKFTEMVEAKVMNLVKPYENIVESIIANVGQGTADPNDPSAIGQGDNPNRARITVNFVEYLLRGGINTVNVMEEIREGLQGYPGVTITVDKNNDGPPVGKPIAIEVSGEEYDELISIVENLKRIISNSDIDGIEKLRTDLETSKPELLVNIDREKARRFGVSSYMVASEIRTSLFGKEVSKFKQGEDDYDIVVRLDDNYRYDLPTILNKSITYRNQVNGNMVQVPISSLAKAEFSSSFGSVRRKDLKRVVTLSSNVISGYNPTDINNQIKALIADVKVPAGYEIKFGGEQEKQAEEMAFLSTALLIAVFMIFLIIVAQFNKITGPFIIMTSVLFSTIGVFLGLVIFRMDFVIIMTMLGIISLAGIVVNNAIVLIDFIELTKRRMEADLDRPITMAELSEAIVTSGKTRLRPVLLTAITTVLGLLPLALGMNIDFISFYQTYDPNFYIGGDNAIFWGPMSWTIIFGLTFATFLTLVIVPVMYILIERINFRLGITKSRVNS